MKKSRRLRISQHQVKHIANLARIGLSDKDIENFQKQLGDIIDYFTLLSEVDTEEIDEVGQITGLENVFREDVVKEFLLQRSSLRNASKTEDGFFKTVSPFKNST